MVKIYNMAQLNLNLILMCTILMYCPLILRVTSSSHVILHTIKMTCQIHENNANKFSKCDRCHQRKQEPQNFAQHILTLLKSLFNTYLLLLMDSVIYTLMGNSNMVMLQYVCSLKSG